MFRSQDREISALLGSLFEDGSLKQEKECCKDPKLESLFLFCGLLTALLVLRGILVISSSLDGSNLLLELPVGVT